MHTATIQLGPDSHGRVPPLRNTWTLLDVLSEPLFYNPNLSGNAGARVSDPPGWMRKARATAMVKCQLLRTSPARRKLAINYYEYTRRMAAAGLTHVVHLLTGLSTSAPLRWLTFPELQASCAARSIPTPCTAAHLSDLIHSLPKPWHDVVAQAQHQKAPHHTLPTLLAAMPLATAWYRHGDLAGASAAHPSTPNGNATIVLSATT